MEIYLCRYPHLRIYLNVSTVLCYTCRCIRVSETANKSDKAKEIPHVHTLGV